MDRAAILLLIQAAGYGTDTGSVAAENRAIDAALLELSSEREWSWLLTTTTGTMSVNATVLVKPSDLVVPKGIYPSYGTINYEPLTEVDAQKMRLNQHLDIGTGLPEYWAWVDRTIAIWPRPDLAYPYRLDYVKEPDTTAFNENTESPPFNIQFHPVIAWGAMRILAFRQRDQNGYAIAHAEYIAAKLNFSQADRRGEQDYTEQWAGWD